MSSVLVALAVQARNRGGFARADSLFRQAIESNPEDADARRGLAMLLEETGRLSEAIEVFRDATALAPGDAAIRTALGRLLLRTGKLDEAETILRAAVAADPALAHAMDSLGVVLAEKGRPAEAETWHRRAVDLDGRSAEARNHLGNALHLLGRYRDAVESYRAALAIAPDFVAAHSNLIYTLSLDPDMDAARHAEERAAWWRAHGARHAAKAELPHENIRDPEKRLRVGYVSGHFRRESAAMAFTPILIAHDSAAVEVVCYSGTERRDDLTETLRRFAPLWRETIGLDDDALADQIRADRVDILVDLAGHMYGNRLPVFARKPAPIQVTAWGEATGTGLRTMDALFSDPVQIPPETRHFYVERVVDLPCHMHYGRPATAPPIAERPRGASFTFGSLNRMSKIGKATLGLWRRVLDDCPQARLLLKDPAFDEAPARDAVAAALGHAERIEFRGRSTQAEHLAVYNDIDIALDTTPQNGGVTTLEALWMGVPSIALLGRTPASRTSASILTAAGMERYIARSPEDYVALARRAMDERVPLADLRRTLPARLASSPLGDPALYARAVEARYRELWRGSCVNG